MRHIASCLWGWKYLVGLIIITWLIALVFLAERDIPDAPHPKNLPDYITRKAIIKHLKHFERIAKENGGNRAVGAGHTATAEYVMKQLEKHVACTPYKQYFKVPVWEEVEPAVVEVFHPWRGFLQTGIDVRLMRYGGKSTTVSSRVVSLKHHACAPNAFSDFPRGAIALANATPLCEPFLAAKAAEDAGASVLILYGSFQSRGLSNARVRIADWKEGDRLIEIPVLSMSHSIGSALAASGNSTVSIVTNATLNVVKTFNVLCDTVRGDPNTTIVAGAHLDGVPAGPGIVDNGSGSATLLETVIQYYQSNRIRKIENRIRFAWWGAEELGLLGSRHYLRDLEKNDPDELKRIVLAVNHDMLASPNGIPGIHNGSTAPAPLRNASLQITSVYSRYFNTTFKHRHHALTDMYAGSDFLPFLLHGIPAGGLDTGAGGIKTAQERRLYGGVAGAPYDGCYHKDCDGVDNVGEELLGMMSKLAAHGVECLANMKDLRKWISGGQK